MLNLIISFFTANGMRWKHWWWATFNFGFILTFVISPVVLSFGSKMRARERDKERMEKMASSLDLRFKISFRSKQMVHLSLFIYLFIYSFWQFPDSLWDCIYSIRLNCSTRMVWAIWCQLYCSTICFSDWKAAWEWRIRKEQERLRMIPNDGTIQRLK